MKYVIEPMDTALQGKNIGGHNSGLDCPWAPTVPTCVACKPFLASNLLLKHS